jgi:hypothetical protein
VAPQWTVHTGQATWALEPAVPVEVHGVDGAAAETLGIGRTGAVLVRPDAIPVRAWTEPDPDDLCMAIKELTA